VAGAVVISVEGSIVLSLSDAAAFIEDASAWKGILQVVATRAGVKAAAVNIDLTLMGTSSPDRRLMGQSVLASYKITLAVDPSKDLETEVAALMEPLASVDTEDFSQEIAREIHQAGGDMYDLEVVSLEPPAVVSRASTSSAAIEPVTEAPLYYEMEEVSSMAFRSLVANAGVVSLVSLASGQLGM